MEEVVKQEENKEQANTEEEVPFSPQMALAEMENAPTKEQIDQWKAQYGHVYITVLGEKEAFIYRPIDREMWKKLNARIADNQREIMGFVEELRKKGATDEQIEQLAKQKEIDQEELTVEAALLWSSIPKAEVVKRAGIITSLANTIMEKSRFVPPQIAAALTEEL